MGEGRREIRKGGRRETMSFPPSLFPSFLCRLHPRRGKWKTKEKKKTKRQEVQMKAQ